MHSIIILIIIKVYGGVILIGNLGLKIKMDRAQIDKEFWVARVYSSEKVFKAGDAG